MVEQARNLAAQPYAPLTSQLPQPLADLDYDIYRAIRFQPAQSLWHGERLFEIQFFHLGFLYREPVRIRVVEDGTVRTLHFNKAMFNYGKTSLKDQLPTDLGFAGFRIHYPLNRPDYKDEVTVFLGASYFRMVGRNQVYGISARGLAIDTALPEGEEFPAFREFWLVRPAPGATSMTVYALLDSESLTGAYRFHLIPDTETAMDVQTTLFARAEVKRLGIAPLTSMFFVGENQVRSVDDYRPEVHDSDGLFMHTGKDERIWRPLSNPKELRVSSLLDEAPRGFGLLQRDRNFAHYLDLESHFECRPSFWVEPRGGQWGKGAVHLIEIPMDEEIHDNIVAFWVSDQPLKAGESRTFILFLFAVTFGWITVAFWTAVIGFVLQLAKLEPISLHRFPPWQQALSAPLTTHTAVVMPVYNEDPAQVLAGLEATFRSLSSAGDITNFDFFLLSDTTAPAIAAIEESGWAVLCRRLGAEGKIFYRRRERNASRKAGNLADFCRRWGEHYDFMVVLDADSIMSGETILTLVRAIQATPRAGIIQTVPMPVGQQTMFGRFVQSASRLYSPMLATGLCFWQLGEANYWGHTVSWNPQTRDDRSIGIHETARYLLVPTLIGVAWGAVTFFLAPQFFWWLTPVLLGLGLAIPLVMWSSRISVGRMLGRLGLFFTPEELTPPAELQAARDVFAALVGALPLASSSLPLPTPPEEHSDMPPQSIETVWSWSQKESWGISRSAT